MKTIIFVLAALFSLAASADVIVNTPAREFTGGRLQSNQNEYSHKATSCNYIFADDPDSADFFKVIILSDEDSSSSFAVYIPRSQYPLREGAKFEARGMKVEYKKGKLKATQTNWDFYIDKIKIELQVSSDLKTVKQAQGVSSMQVIRKLVNYDMNCKF